MNVRVDLRAVVEVALLSVPTLLFLAVTLVEQVHFEALLKYLQAMVTVATPETTG